MGAERETPLRVWVTGDIVRAKEPSQTIARRAGGVEFAYHLSGTKALIFETPPPWPLFSAAVLKL